MSDSAASGASSLGALAALGSLRECLFGLQNLEHLVASRSAGPRILEQVVPDVAESLMRLPSIVEELLSSVQKCLHLTSKEVALLSTFASDDTHHLTEALRSAAVGPIHARSRLLLEQKLRQSMPPIVAAGAQMELLAEAATGRAVPMSVLELLTSGARSGSDRPERQVVMIGPADQLWTAVPARTGLRCLGALSSLFEPDVALDLTASAEGSAVVLTLSPTKTAPGTKVFLPILPRTETTRLCVDASLRAFGGSLGPSKSEIRLPACAPDGKFSP